jgi:hypothetical protein
MSRDTDLLARLRARIESLQAQRNALHMRMDLIVTEIERLSTALEVGEESVLWVTPDDAQEPTDA